MDSIPLGKTDKDDVKHAKLKAFIASVSSGRLVQYWDSADALRANAIISLTKAFSENPQTGWVRANQIADSSAMADIVKYRNQVDELTGELESARSSLSPKFDDAADLSQKVEFDYKFYNYSTDQEVNSSCKISLFDFLKFVAPSLNVASPAVYVKLALCLALKERLYVSGGRDVTTNSSQVQDALMHLVATGHLRMFQTTATAKSESETAYQLTLLGLKVWQEHSYIKKERVVVI